MRTDPKKNNLRRYIPYIASLNANTASLTKASQVAPLEHEVHTVHCARTDEKNADATTYPYYFASLSAKEASLAEANLATQVTVNTHSIFENISVYNTICIYINISKSMSIHSSLQPVQTHLPNTLYVVQYTISAKGPCLKKAQ